MQLSLTAQKSISIQHAEPVWECHCIHYKSRGKTRQTNTNNTSFSGHHHKTHQLHADVFQWTTESFLPINRSGPTKLLQQSWDLLRSADLQCELMSLQGNISCREITCLIRRWSTSMEHTITVENKSIHCDVQQLKDQQKKHIPRKGWDQSNSGGIHPPKS